MMKRLFILLLLLLPLTACGPMEQNLSFETISDLSDTHQSPYPKTRGLEIITRPDQLAQLLKWIPTLSSAPFHQVDLNQSIIVALIEQHSAGGYHVYIDRIARQEQVVRVYATFTTLVGGDVFTTPRHIVALKKDGSWKGTFTFELVKEGHVILTTTAEFP